MLNMHNITDVVYSSEDTSESAPVNIFRNGKTESGRADSDVGDGGVIAWLAEGGTIGPYVEPDATGANVTRERDRRIAGGFIFGGNEYQTDQGSRENIGGAQGLSLGAMIADPGGALGLRWMNPDKDFAWTDLSNKEIAMTAAECQAFCQRAMQYKTDLIKSARVIKETNPIPGDYANDSHWPNRTLD